ncbi:hypothetical protein HZ994_09895 [Akkermansiaceae bacterium]|nr:hypothetical protein HZ994_09895 [Akkermansiaceae bacterium]
MKALLLMTMIALTGNALATKFAPPKSHDVESTNGKFKLHVNAEDGGHEVTGDFRFLKLWKFHHDISNHSFFVSDDGEAAVVVHWAWCKADELDEPAVVIYGRDGARRIFTYRQLSTPRKPGEDEIGPIGDFWRLWRDDATIKGNLLTIQVEGRKTQVIDLKTAACVEVDKQGNPAENGH